MQGTHYRDAFRGLASFFKAKLCHLHTNMRLENRPLDSVSGIDHHYILLFEYNMYYFIYLNKVQEICALSVFLLFVQYCILRSEKGHTTLTIQPELLSGHNDCIVMASFPTISES